MCRLYRCVLSQRRDASALPTSSVCSEDAARSGKALDRQAGMLSDGSWEMGLGGCCRSRRRAVSENGAEP